LAYVDERQQLPECTLLRSLGLSGMHANLAKYYKTISIILLPNGAAFMSGAQLWILKIMPK